MRLQVKLWHVITAQLIFLASIVWAADSRITDLTELTNGNVAAGDVVELVDVSDTTDNAAGSSRKTLLSSLFNAIFSGDISPTALSADTNDWAPSNCATNMVIRASADQARTVTGLSCSQVDGFVRILENVGATQDSVLILSTANTGSTAANRFDFGVDAVLGPGESIILIYDGTNSRWNQAAREERLDRDRRRLPFYATDFLGGATADTGESTYAIWDFAVVASGTQTKTAGVADHPGIQRCTSSTTTNSGCSFITAATAFRFGGGESTEFVFQIPSLTNTTLRVGFHDATSSTDAVDGAYIEVPGTGAAVCKTANNSTRTTSATIATLSAATWYRAMIRVDRTAANVFCEIFDTNGNSLGSQTNSANIPTTAGREFGHGFVATNSGTTAVGVVDMDYMSIWYEKALIR